MMIAKDQVLQRGWGAYEMRTYIPWTREIILRSWVEVAPDPFYTESVIFTLELNFMFAVP